MFFKIIFENTNADKIRFHLPYASRRRTYSNNRINIDILPRCRVLLLHIPNKNIPVARPIFVGWRVYPPPLLKAVARFVECRYRR